MEDENCVAISKIRTEETRRPRVLKFLITRMFTHGYSPQVTIMLYLGYTLKDIQTWLGHSNYNFTADTYIHSGAGVHEQMAERLSEELKSLLPQNPEPPNLAENLSMC